MKYIVVLIMLIGVIWLGYGKTFIDCSKEIKVLQPDGATDVKWILGHYSIGAADADIVSQPVKNGVIVIGYGYSVIAVWGIPIKTSNPWPIKITVLCKYRSKYLVYERELSKSDTIIDMNDGLDI